MQDKRNPSTPDKLVALPCALPSTTALYKGDDLSFGVPAEIAPDLYLVRVPLPTNPLKALNSYIILSKEDTTIVDVGFNHPDCEKALNRSLVSLGRSWQSVRLVVTHSHPDHTGNIDRIYRKDMPIFSNIPSFQEVKNLQVQERQTFGPLMLKVAKNSDAMQSCHNDNENMLVTPPVLLPLKSRAPINRLVEGEVFSAGRYHFEVIETPGHDPWHICLYDRQRRLMLVGDHVLSHITPYVSSWLPNYDALGKFIKSLERMASYRVDYALPAHGTLNNVAGRAHELKAHHQERLHELYELVGQGHSDIINLSAHAKWRYKDWHSWPVNQKYFSMGETMAHMIHLVRSGKLAISLNDNEYHFTLP